MKHSICRGIFVLIPVFFVSNAMGITPEEFNNATSQGGKLTLIDIRGNSAFTKSHVPGAINIPARLCETKQFPPLGRVVVYGDGIATDEIQAVVSCLNRKSGITADVLDGGFQAGEELKHPGTGNPGLEKSEYRYLSYEELVKISKSSPDLVIVDIRNGEMVGVSVQGVASQAESKTDLLKKFPRTRSVAIKRDPRQSKANNDHVKKVMVNSGKRKHSLYVIVDDGDGASEMMAMKLRAAGIRRIAILSGGELSLKREGRSGMLTLSQ